MYHILLLNVRVIEVTGDSDMGQSIRDIAKASIIVTTVIL